MANPIMATKSILSRADPIECFFELLDLIHMLIRFHESKVAVERWEALRQAARMDMAVVELNAQGELVLDTQHAIILFDPKGVKLGVPFSLARRIVQKGWGVLISPKLLE